MDVQKENPELYDKVQAYVWKNYTNYTNKKLIIREFDSHFKININREDAPLILGRSRWYRWCSRTSRSSR